MDAALLVAADVLFLLEKPFKFGRENFIIVRQMDVVVLDAWRQLVSDVDTGWNLGLALTGPSQTTEIDANRSAVFRNGFKKKKHMKSYSLHGLIVFLKLNQAGC